MGPVVNRVQQEKVHAHIHAALAEGAKIAAQAPMPTDPALTGGFYVAPTLFSGVTRDMRIATEEVFGPVVTVTAFDTEDDAVEITNASEYGLVCGIYSRDSERAFRVARRVQAGIVLVNNYFRGVLGTPFGGTKHSGFGREHCVQTLQEYGYTKMIRYPSGRGTVPSWRAVREIEDDLAPPRLGSPE